MTTKVTKRGTTAIVLLAMVSLLSVACSSDDSTESSDTTAGSTSDEMKQYQTDLNTVGCSAGPVDGIDGGETEAAIRAFQAHSGLPVDGVIGPETSDALSADAAAGTEVCPSSPPSTDVPPSSTPDSSDTPSSCPPNCGPNLSVNPGSGNGGTVYLSSAGSECAGPVEVTATNQGESPQQPEPAGELTAQGAGQYGMYFSGFVTGMGTIEQIDYLFTATACGATAQYIQYHD